VLAAIRACQAPYAVIVVPLLFETENYLTLIQRSLVVDCAEANQIARTTTRSGLSETEVRTIMDHQLHAPHGKRVPTTSSATKMGRLPCAPRLRRYMPSIYP